MPLPIFCRSYSFSRVAAHRTLLFPGCFACSFSPSDLLLLIYSVPESPLPKLARSVCVDCKEREAVSSVDPGPSLWRKAKKFPSCGLDFLTVGRMFCFVLFGGFSLLLNFLFIAGVGVCG